MQTTAARAERPFPIPSDLKAGALLPQALTAACVAAMRREPAENVVRRLFGRSPSHLGVLALIQKSATNPATTTTTAWAAELAGVAVGSFVSGLQGSAAAALIRAAGQPFDMSGVTRVLLPRSTDTGQPAWVAEGAPVPVGAGSLTNVTLGPPRKLGLAEVITGELADYSQPAAEETVTALLSDAARRELDKQLFSAVAGDTTKPPGLLVGLSTLTPTTGGGLSAALSDMGKLADAIVAAGAGGNIMFFTSIGNAVKLRAYAPAEAARIVGSAWIPSTRLIAVDAEAFASGFDSVPEIRASQEVLLHMDTNPVQFSTPGSPPVVAAPSRDMFQSDCIAFRMILRAAWCLRIPSAAAFVDAPTW